jgi:hypothetical protein
MWCVDVEYVLIYPEDGGSAFIRNVGKLLGNYMVWPNILAQVPENIIFKFYTQLQFI